MARPNVWLIWSLILVISLVLFGVYFFTTGGAGLYRTVVYYLIPDLQDQPIAKTFSWIDFVYKDADRKVSGFYAGGDDQSIKIWTLSGLKRFYAKPKFSSYSFLDTCAAVKQINESGGKAASNNEQVYLDFNEWRELLQKENFITVWPAGKENGRVMIDKTLARSGKYKILGKVEAGVCD